MTFRALLTKEEGSSARARQQGRKEECQAHQEHWLAVNSWQHKQGKANSNNGTAHDNPPGLSGCLHRSSAAL